MKVESREGFDLLTGVRRVSDKNSRFEKVEKEQYQVEPELKLPTE